jgi:acetyl-CoA C-acetyltransferase
MKAIMNGASLIALRRRDVVVCGGMESMSQVPYYLPSNRFGKKYGNSECIDGLQKDGLYDSFNQFLMGNAAELCAEKYNLTREMQDEYAAQSYKRAKAALESKEFRQEIVPIKVHDRKKGTRILDKDEEVFNINFDKMKELKPAFKKNGTVTAANASKLSDGASAVVLGSLIIVKTDFSSIRSLCFKE